EAALRAVEIIRDGAAESYTISTGDVWSPWKGGTKTLTSTAAQIDAREWVAIARDGCVVRLETDRRRKPR
ncbi:MAG: hypothetical protein ACYDD1_23385, partial [Caulobacteraceae bacterium]